MNGKEEGFNLLVAGSELAYIGKHQAFIEWWFGDEKKSIG